MDIKQLKFLIALDQTRHFGKAAELCHVTQPALSMRIRNLEEELDLVLIERGQRFEGFTEGGERVLAWARSVLAAYDGLRSEAANCRGELVGNLRLGIVPLSSLNPMALVQPLFQRYPELSFQLRSMSSEEIVDGLMRNQLDLGLCYLEHIDPEHFESLELGTTRMGLLYDIRHFQFEQAELSWEEISSLPLGLLTRGTHYRHSIALNFSSRGLDPRPILESDSTMHLVQAVSTGMCCAMMPLQSGVESLSEELRILPVIGATTMAPMGLLMRRTEPRSALAERCFEAAREIFMEEAD